MNPIDTLRIYEKSQKENLEIYAGLNVNGIFAMKIGIEIFARELNADYLIFGPHWVYDTGNFIYAQKLTQKNSFYLF